MTAVPKHWKHADPAHDPLTAERVDSLVQIGSIPLWAQHRRCKPRPLAEVVRLVPVGRTARVPLDGPRVATVGLIAAARGERGLTCLELEEEAGWRHSVASAALSTAKKRGVVRFDGRTRDGFGVHVAVTP